MTQFNEDLQFMFKPIKSIPDAVQYVQALHAADLLYHFDDDIFEIFEDTGGVSIMQIRSMDHRCTEMFNLDWSKSAKWDNPFDLAIEVAGL